MRNCCEPTIPRSGKEGKNINCFIVAFNREDSKYFVAKSYSNNKLGGLKWNDKKYADKYSIKLENVVDYKLRIIHYYGFDQVIYDSIYDFIWHKLTKYVYLKIHIHKYINSISQHFFRKRMLVTKRRMDLLLFMMKDQLDRTHNGITILDLMTKLYTIKWILHPSANDKQKELELYLQSLEASEDLSIINNEYIITGKAISTLEKYEEKERRHTESVRLQRIMVFLTIILALFTIFQSGVIKVPTLIDLTTPNPHKQKIQPNSYVGS